MTSKQLREAGKNLKRQHPGRWDEYTDLEVGRTALKNGLISEEPPSAEAPTVFSLKAPPSPAVLLPGRQAVDHGDQPDGFSAKTLIPVTAERKPDVPILMSVRAEEELTELQPKAAAEQSKTKADERMLLGEDRRKSYELQARVDMTSTSWLKKNWHDIRGNFKWWVVGLLAGGAWSVWRWLWPLYERLNPVDKIVIGALFFYLLFSIFCIIVYLSRRQSLKHFYNTRISLLMKTIEDLQRRLEPTQCGRKHDGAAWQLTEGNTEDGPYCPLCWEKHRHFISSHINVVEGRIVQFYCNEHSKPFLYEVPEALVKGRPLDYHRT